MGGGAFELTAGASERAGFVRGEVATHLAAGLMGFAFGDVRKDWASPLVGFDVGLGLKGIW